MFLYKILFSLWGFLEIIIVVISLFGNSIVIYVMSREKKLRKKSSFYIVSLAVADLLTCVFTIVMTVMRSFKFLDHEYEFPVKLCYVLNSLLLMLTTVSIFQLVFVAADRYWAVCLPISYHRRTPRFAKFIICLCWLIGLTFGLVPWLDNWAVENCLLHVISLKLHVVLGSCLTVLIIIMYSLIYRAFSRQVSLLS